jgi:lipoprotein-anchoring transpeptidase ErfK/SrfK
MQIDGNTPSGTYEVTQIHNTSAWDQKSYGPNGALRLKPVSGNALAAETQSGRKGLLIHGGSPGGEGYWRHKQASDLRATHGCVRLSDHDMGRLAAILLTAQTDPTGPRSKQINVRLTVGDIEASVARP